jgi:Flp pilus assembly pilin Flp
VHRGDRALHRVLGQPLRTIARPAWSERGQGTVEYVALVALVALIMVGVIAAMKSTQFAEGQQLGSLILKKIAEAVSKVHY